MTIYLTSRRLALLAGGGLLAALSLSGVAQAVTDTIFQYTAPKTGYSSISVMAMAPGSTSSGDAYSSIWSSPGHLTAASGCFMTGVNLPNSARMTQLTVWTTSGAGSDPILFLVRHALTDGTAHFFVQQPFPDNSGTRKRNNVAIPNTPTAVVNNASYTYGFGICLNDGDSFHGARVAYTYTHAGD